MLLEFKTKNYKSFVEEAHFSMTAAPKQTGLDYSLLHAQIRGKAVKALCSSVVYGPNAAGKTNLIGAMDTFRAIVLRGHIRNHLEFKSPNHAASALELIPNQGLKKAEPVEFSVMILKEGFRIQYKLVLDLGAFLASKHKRSILNEELIVNGENIYKRTENLVLGDMKGIKKYLSSSLDIANEETVRIAINSLDREELFLTNGFRIVFSAAFTKLVTDWFANEFTIIYRADSIKLTTKFAASDKNMVLVEDNINKAAKAFGINSNALGYITGDEEGESELHSLFNNLGDGKSAAMSAEVFESYGTIRFINLFPLIIRALETGGVLVVDEFDASIHPMALVSLVNIFHNDDINIKKAQLIFNTHNPIFLNPNIFRRDEIKFVERDDNTNESILYSLSDFGTAGRVGVRKTDDYMHNYFINRYGGIKNIDFTPFFEELLVQKGGVDL